ncbi:SARP family transcriptional regulator [Nocardiopsis kunsanensis]|uniref:SARP family transcriptional regulator n=1 Tax=Nocardiopsis kunsanensis TaxID=141693 RepID=A0A918XIV0_9ACTN|nr:AfsR/SARP family transcriptional regulator [Nocardiopsis kunsanensis]GHD32630.1 SARP family transcriptional regulator [Nocardiopsis kunsanensis]
MHGPSSTAPPPSRPPNGLTFGVLGSLTATRGGRAVDIPAGRQQVVLAALLLEPGRVVSTDHLVDAIWGENPPATARAQVQICVSRLRKSLAGASSAEVIKTRPPGYLLRAEDGTVDHMILREQVREARAREEQGLRQEAVAALEEALSLWRGPALNGIDSPLLAAKAVRLDEECLNALENRIRIELDLGEHLRLVGELRYLASEYPLRERFRAQLMLALHRSGRQAEALEVYRVGRDHLAEELGLDPGEELRAAEAAILAAGDNPVPVSSPPVQPDPGPAESPATGEPGDWVEEHFSHLPFEVPTPHQLTADTADFVGREDLVSSFERVLVSPDGGHALGVAVVLGRPGVGKSALAVHVGHRVAAEHFPDGQLYCDLRGTRDQPLTASDVLGRFLRALGVPGPTVPEDVDERAELYRTVMAQRRVLIVLDDAATERQFLPLLPGSSSCGVVVTSRLRLTGVPGSHVVELDVLTMDQSLQLLERALGVERVEAERKEAEELVRTVGRLPLAIRIVAARLAARPHWSLASLLDRLADERDRLDELEHGDLTIRASLSLTYDGMSERDRRLLRRLSALDGSSIPGWVAGALLDDHRRSPSDLVETLVDAQMLDVSTLGPGAPHYRFHDVIRVFAREKLSGEASEERTEAVARLCGAWLAMAEEAHRRVYGGDHLLVHGDAPRWLPPGKVVDAELHSPMDWLDAERANLCSVVGLAADTGLDEVCWDLASSLVTLFERRSYLSLWEETIDRAMAASRSAGNRRGIAALMHSRGSLLLNRREHDQAQPLFSAALEEFTDLGDALGRAKCNRALAYVEYRRGRTGSALRLCEKALEDFRDLGDPVGQGHTLLLNGQALLACGWADEAWVPLEEALSCYEACGDGRGRAQILRTMSSALQESGEHDWAEQLLCDAHALVVELQDPIGEGFVLHDLGRINAAAGRRSQARLFLGRALVVREQIQDAEGAADVRRDLSLLEGEDRNGGRGRETAVLPPVPAPVQF